MRRSVTRDCSKSQVLLSGPARGDRALPVRRLFALYVEGPSDLDILQVWARRLSPSLARVVERSAVILGGRRPARALEHFRRFALAGRDMRGVCVLDRDGRSRVPEPLSGDARLEFFTWPRRHIESYLLVPDAIRRCLHLPRGDTRVERVLREHIPGPCLEASAADVDAKRLLASRGPIAREFGCALSPAGIARCMRRDELHSDVLDLFERVRDGVGLRETQHHIVRRVP